MVSFKHLEVLDGVSNAASVTVDKYRTVQKRTFKGTHSQPSP